MNEEESTPDEGASTLPPLSFFAELKRRKVVRASIAYLIVAWLVIQVAATTFPSFEIPAWGLRMVIILSVLGFPLVIVLAWAFELAPDGVKRTEEKSSSPGEAPPDPTQDRKRNLAAFGIGALVPTAGFLFVLGFLLLRPSPPQGDTEPNKLETARTIAVLPFSNLSTEAENAFFARGVHEDILTQLAQLKDLQVASKTSVLRYGDQPDNLRTIAAELGVRYIVEGSVRRSGDEVRISVQLIDATTDTHLWAENFDRRLENIFALQSSISREIARRLQARIRPAEEALLDAVPTTVVAAYDAYLKVRGTLTGFWVGFDLLAEAEAQLQFATRADPAFVEGWALLGTVYSRQSMQLRNLDLEDPAAKAAAEAAFAALEVARELNPNHLATLRALGFYNFIITQDYLLGSRYLDRAVQRVPNDTETLATLGFVYRRLGRLDEAIEVLERAYALERATPYVFGFLTGCLHDTAQYARLVPIYEDALKRNPESLHLALESRYYRFLASGSLADFKAYEEALGSLQINNRCDPSSWRQGRMSVAMLNDEFDAYAIDWHVEWEAHHADHGDWVCPLQVNEEANHAALLFRQGNEEEANAIIERSFHNVTLPADPLATCTFDTEMIRPKLYHMSGEPEAAVADFDRAVRKLNEKPETYLKYLEKAVLLEAADLIAPAEVFALYEDIANDPVRLVTLEIICANPWTYPHLLATPAFKALVGEDGRFVAFLKHYDFL